MKIDAMLKQPNQEAWARYSHATNLYMEHQKAGSTNEEITDSALRDYEEAIKINPSFADAYALAGVLCRHKAIFVINKKRCHDLEKNAEAGELLDKSKKYLGKALLLDKGLRDFARKQMSETEGIVVRCEQDAGFDFNTLARIITIN